MKVAARCDVMSVPNFIQGISQKMHENSISLSGKNEGDPRIHQGFFQAKKKKKFWGAILHTFKIKTRTLTAEGRRWTQCQERFFWQKDWKNTTKMFRRIPITQPDKRWLLFMLNCLVGMIFQAKYCLAFLAKSLMKKNTQPDKDSISIFNAYFLQVGYDFVWMVFLQNP